jgi:hypothetical protein
MCYSDVLRFTSFCYKKLRSSKNTEPDDEDDNIISPILHVYGCETWSLTIREEHSLRMFKNMVPRRIFGQTAEEVTGGRKKMHNRGHHNLYTSADWSNQ